MPSKSSSLLRALLVLGRISNLPTVWSNCLAGWWLGGDGNYEVLPLLFVGATLLYLGGMFLNDAFDVEFDRQYRQERPIPSEIISAETVWRWGLILLAAGGVCLICLGKMTGILGIILIFSIIFYDAFHKQTRLAPVLMGICRLLLYLVASSTALNCVTGWSMWSGLALALYIVGLSSLARRESARGPVAYWPAMILAAPILLALLLNANDYRQPAWLLSAVLALWILRSLRQLFRSNPTNIGRVVSSLLAGIVFVDWLAVADAPRRFGFFFIAFFLCALLLQRIAPAT